MQRNAVGQDAVQVGVRVHEAGREGLAGCLDDLVFRVRCSQLDVGRDRGDLITDHAHPPALLRRLAGNVDEKIGKDHGSHDTHLESVNRRIGDNGTRTTHHAIHAYHSPRARNRPPPGSPTNSPSRAITRPRSIVHTG